MDESVVRVIATGGTIDEDHTDHVTGRSLFTQSRVPQMLADAGITNGVAFETLFTKDSSDITEEERKRILEHCLSCPEKRIVITHGTNTMVETAVALGKNVHNKTVVLVGAFIPFIREGSDAVPNLKFAIEKVKQLSPGVYIAMNGELFLWNNVRKNKDKRVFENLEKTVE
ncbi:MAG: asparaginase domain-containing protein [bacterium]|nr:asparaginase domain-containing protein [bacterium]